MCYLVTYQKLNWRPTPLQNCGPINSEKYFEKVLQLFPDGLVFYCAERGLIYANNYTKKLCLNLASNDEVDDSDFEKYDISQVLDCLIEKGNNSNSLRQCLMNIYHKLKANEIHPKISPPSDENSLLTDICYENEFVHKTFRSESREFHVR